MEKTMSVEDRIRKAEEIYSKRNGQYINTSNRNCKKDKFKGIKKIIMQMFICLMIYLAFYIFTNSNYIFSEDFLNQVKGNFSQDSKINNIYLNIKSYFKQKFSPRINETVENVDKNIKNEINSESKDENIDIKLDNTENIGGAEEKLNNKDKNNKQEVREKSKIENDIEKIKKEINFIVPVKGTISSTFGWRTPTTKTVPKYHTGIDIAAKEGTVIKSATDGKVILASSEGDYGKHYKIKTNDLTIIYAHCKKLYLKQNAKVKQGDKIGEVGSTGNSTGPHLHFEIRKGEELIDPQLILNI